MDPAFVENRVVERARLIEPVAEGELVEIRTAQRKRPSSITAAERLPDDPNAFRLEVIKLAVQRAEKQVIDDVRARLAGDPASIKLMRRFAREGEFNEGATPPRPRWRT